MRISNKDKNRILNIFLIVFITFLIVACFITLLLDINANKGIIPIMYILIMIYSLLIFLYHLFYDFKYDRFSRKTIQFKFSYLILFIICLFLFMLTFIVLWM